MTSYAATYASHLYLKVLHLMGMAFVLTIKGVGRGKLADGTPAPELSFEETEKLFTVNKTNGDSIVAMAGDEIEDWVGLKIELYPSTTDSPRGVVDCIRIRPPSIEMDAPRMPAPPAAQPSEPDGPYSPSAQPTLDDSIPF